MTKKNKNAKDGNSITGKQRKVRVHEILLLKLDKRITKCTRYWWELISMKKLKVQEIKQREKLKIQEILMKQSNNKKN